MRWRLVGFVVAAGLGASVLFAKTGVVTMKDGRTYEGDVQEKDAKTVIVNIHGGETFLERDGISKIEYHDSLLDQFNDQLAKLDGKDVQGRIKLARWAFDQEQYDLSRQALEQALGIDPKNKEAQDLLDTVRSQIRLQRVRTTQPTTLTVGPGAAEFARNSPQSDRKLLTANEINKIRQEELRATDTAVRFNFTNDVKKRWATLMNKEIGYLNAMRPLDQALAILDGNYPEGVHLSDDVRVLSDPASIRDYRNLIQPIIMSGCATSGCHGGPNGGKFILYTLTDNAEAVTYTNFYILTQYTKKIGSPTPGVFGSGERRMIDRGQANLSLLVQYGLPPEIAEFDHPSVRNFRPVFHTLQDQDLRRFVTWMNDSLRPMNPDYGISYTPPVGKGSPATNPTTHAASAPTTAPRK
jgi:tetratricopeptide (TPR) repeat protein